MFSPENVASLWYSAFNNKASVYSEWKFLSHFKTMDVILDAEFQKCDKLPCPSFDITPPAGTLNAFSAIQKIYDTKMIGPVNAYVVANGIMTYWSKAIKKGTPCYYSRVVSVTNDAMNYVGPLASDILSIRTTKLSNGYLSLANVIYNNIKKINWYITEDDGEDTYNYIGKVI